ncbi:MAG: mechanosensitive ion channel family protein [Cyclobacteriaceae bacterium]|nr:mechanosensitive ion channel family protein [Cyclobacteriaceae bacterium]
MSPIDEILGYFEMNRSRVIFSLILVVTYFLIKSTAKKLIKNHARTHQVDYSRELYVRKLASVSITLLMISLMGMIWEISIQGVSIYFASIFTIVGVALFANWSLLSNVTASVIIFFFFPVRVGTRIKILDGDNTVVGIIKDIGLFHIKIKTEDGLEVSYPNNLVMQKPLMELTDE